MIELLQSVDFLGYIAALAFLVNVIVEMIKDLGVLKKIPTKLVAIVTSIIVTISVSVIFLQLNNLKINGSYVVSMIIAAFPIAYIATYGYDSFKELYKKFKEEK